jgi:hypothetical protein
MKRAFDAIGALVAFIVIASHVHTTSGPNEGPCFMGCHG